MFLGEMTRWDLIRIDHKSKFGTHLGGIKEIENNNAHEYEDDYSDVENQLSETARSEYFPFNPIQFLLIPQWKTKR